MNIELYINEYLNFINKNQGYIASNLMDTIDAKSYHRGQIKTCEDILSFINANKNKSIENRSHEIQFKEDEVDN